LPFRPAGTQTIRCRQKSVNHKLDSLTNEQNYLVAIQINNDLFYLDLLKFFMPYMPCSDINETEESPFAYVELSYVNARNGIPQLRLNDVMGLPIATISTGNNDLAGALPHKLLVKLLDFITFSYQSASAAFASPSELFFPSHLPPPKGPTTKTTTTPTSPNLHVNAYTTNPTKTSNRLTNIRMPPNPHTSPRPKLSPPLSNAPNNSTTAPTRTPS